MIILKIEGKDKQFIKGAFALTFSAILVKLVGVIYKVPISYILGDEGMGYFNSAYTLYGFFFLICSSGIPKAITMVVSDRMARGDKKNGLPIGKIILVFFLFSLALSGVLLILSKSLAEAIGNKGALLSIRVILPSLIFICVGGVIRGYLNGVLSLVPIAISQVIEAGLKLVLGLGFALAGVKLGFALEAVCAFSVFGITLSTLVTCVFLIIVYKKSKQEKKTGQKAEFATKGVLKETLKIAIPITLSSSMLALCSVADLALIMHRLLSLGYTEVQSSAAYGNYTTLAVPMLNLVISVVTPISVAILPRLRADAALFDKASFSDNLKSALKGTAIISAPCFFFFTVYSPQLLDILFKSEAAEFGAPLLCVLSPAILFTSLSTVFNTALEALGRIKLAVASTLIGTAIKLLLGYFLIGNPKINILGAPIGTAISSAVTLLLSLVFFNKCFGRSGAASVIFPSLFLSFFSVYLFYFLHLMFFGSDIGILSCIVLCLLSAAIYLFLLLKTGIIGSFKNFIGESRQNN